LWGFAPHPFGWPGAFCLFAGLLTDHDRGDRQVWEQLNDDRMATEESAEGDLAGAPSCEITVMRPNTTTMVLSEFWSTPDDIE